MSVPLTKADLKASHHLSSGALSGLTSAVILQPLDLLKTRLQQSNEGKNRRRLGSVVRDVLRADGVAGLWRGTVPTVVRNVPGVALYFYSLSSIRASLSRIAAFATPPPLSAPVDTQRTGPGPQRSALVKLSSGGNLVAGAVARTSVGFILNPITVLKTRYESNAYNQYRSLPSAFADLVRTSGIRGLFQGFTATAVRDAPYAGLYVVFYEKGKEVASRLMRPEWGVPNAAIHSGSAVSASMFATILTSPADCVKVSPDLNPTIRQAVARIYGDRGVAGFFSGSALRVSRKAASSAIAWTVYEGLLLVWQRQSGGAAR